MRQEIKNFEFNVLGTEQIKNLKYGTNWPVVYILNGKKEAYVGETTSAYKRMQQHSKNKARKTIETVNIIYDSEFNKSAILDIEALLINYMSADQKYTLQNKTSGISSENDYYNRKKYLDKFDGIWNQLIKKGLANHNRLFLENLDIFKFSPYKTLTEDQYSTAIDIVKTIFDKKIKDEKQTFVVSGKPGTGKSVLAVFLMKFLTESHDSVGDYGFDSDNVDFSNIMNLMINYQGDMKIGLVVPMQSLRKTLKTVFSQIKGLKASMVIGPSEVAKKHYDILIVDEAHRLRRKVNLMPGLANAFNNINEKLNIQDGDELDWIMKQSDYQIFFYDANQSVKPSDVRKEKFSKLLDSVGIIQYSLSSQMRVQGGDYYISAIYSLLDQSLAKVIKPQNYELKLFDDVDEMINQIKLKEEIDGLCRVVAGYAWSWKTKKLSYETIKKENITDIQINQYHYIWNHADKDWVNSANAINEIGCIHTIQGYDLNYVGVIVGPEIKYDEETDKIYIDAKQYCDINGKKSVKDLNELFDYIKNIYKVLLTRGIKGTYIYVCDESLRKYFKKYMGD